MPRRRFSVLNLVLGIINILVGIAPPCAGLIGVMMMLGQGQGVIVNNRDVGPQFKQHIEKNLPAAKPEALSAMACNSLLSLLLIGGAAGLFFAQEWGRWLTIGAALLLCLTLCIHDIYQLLVFRPAVLDFLDLQMPPGPEREGFKIGFTGSLFLWSWANPALMIYLLAMSVTLGIFGLLRTAPDDDDRPRSKRRRRDDRDYDDDE